MITKKQLILNTILHDSVNDTYNISYIGKSVNYVRSGKCSPEKECLR